MISIKAIKPVFKGKQTAIEALKEFPLIAGQELEYAQSCGIKSVYEAEGFSSYALAHTAAEAILAENGLEGNDLDFIIFIKSRTPDHFISSEATRLKHDLKADKALVFSISDLGCADSSMALKLAKDLLLANRKANHVLICYGSKQYAANRFRYPVTFTGDAGLACIIGRGEENTIKDIQIESNGSYWDLFKIEYKEHLFEDYQESCSDLRRYGFELAIESKNRFQKINERIFNANELDWSGINHYLMQNISSRAFDYYEQAFDIKLSPVCKMNLSNYGHLGSGDILLNFYTALQNGMFQQGDQVLIMNNSPVAAWASVLIEI